jgi:hypothetical protein
MKIRTAFLSYFFGIGIDMLSTIELTPIGSSTVHIYTQTVQYTFTHKQYTEQHN